MKTVLQQLVLWGALLLALNACSKRPLTPSDDASNNFSDGQTVIHRIVAGIDFNSALTDTAESRVRVLEPVTGKEIFNIPGYAVSYKGGLQLAQGDFNDDGIPDIVIAPGYGGGNMPVRIVNGQDGKTELFTFFPFGENFNRAIFVTCGDIDNDNLDDIVVGTGPQLNTEGRVRVFSGATKQKIRDFAVQAASASTFGMAIVSIGDVNGDGQKDLIVAINGSVAESTVRIFNGATSAEMRSFIPFAGFKGQIFAAGADIDGDGKAEVVASANLDGPNSVRIFNYATLAKVQEFVPFPGVTFGGAILSTIDVEGDGIDELLIGHGQYSSHAVIFDGLTAKLRSKFEVFPAYNGGVAVSGR